MEDLDKLIPVLESENIKDIILGTDIANNLDELQRNILKQKLLKNKHWETSNYADRGIYKTHTKGGTGPKIMYEDNKIGKYWPHSRYIYIK